MDRRAEDLFEEQRFAARRLSPAAERLLDQVELTPALLSREVFAPLYAAARRRIPTILGMDPAGPYRLQPWPLLLSSGRAAEMAKASRSLVRLIRQIPRRAFGDDPAAVQRYYGLDSELLATLLLSHPHGMDDVPFRLDVVDTPQGWKCLEVNAGNVAGWPTNALGPVGLGHGPLAGFLEEEKVHWDDTVGPLIRHAVERCVAEPDLLDGGGLNVAVVAAAKGVYSLRDNHDRALYDRAFQAALAELAPGVRGRLHLVGPDDLRFEAGRLVLGGDRIHGVLEILDEPTRRDLFRAFKAGQLKLLSAPAGPLVLGDKRNLALLSEHAGDGLLDPVERELVERFVPWTRRVSATATASFPGAPERVLPDLLREHRRDLVLKGGLSVGGEHVVVGRHVSEERWRQAMESALAGDGWVVQEHLDVATVPLQLADGGAGWAPHRVVWGPFIFGDRYGGVFVRVAPADRDPVVNVSNGAEVALAYVAGDD